MSGSATRLLDTVWYTGHWLKWVLWLPSLIFAGAVLVRRWLYRGRILRCVRFATPVVVVGNISVGGTGKTPCIVWLARELKRRGYRVGIVTRGYGGLNRQWPQPVRPDSSAASLGDEPVLLAQRTGCPVVAGPDRAAAVRELLAATPVDVVLSDDGLQHYRMARAFEIALVDGVRGLGNGLCLPGGPLREPAARLEEVDAVIVNSGTWGHTGVLRGELKLVRLYHLASGASKSLAEFKGSIVHAVAGIGHPDRFFNALRAHGLDVDPRPLADHADISAADLAFDDEAPVFITEKDAVKCRDVAHEAVWCVVADFVFADRDDERLMRLIMRRLDAKDRVL